MTVTAEDVETAVDHVAAALRAGIDRDWSVPAGSLTWSCARTADHVGSCLVAYAGQLAVRPTDRYPPFDARADDDASPAGVLEFVVAGGRMLAAMVRTTPPDVLAYHPYGNSDPAGFAGAGCVETLVHGYDIGRGLGLDVEPPRDLCARVIARMFPSAPAGDPWTVLLWSTGRVDLPGHERVQRWRWHGAPLT